MFLFIGIHLLMEERDFVCHGSLRMFVPRRAVFAAAHWIRKHTHLAFQWHL